MSEQFCETATEAPLCSSILFRWFLCACFDEIEWVYERGHEPRCSVPEAEAYQKDFYSFDKNGTRNVDTERWSAQLEKRIAQLITELVSSKREPAGAEKTCLAVFMGTMYTRTPLGRQLGDERFQTSHFAEAQERCCRRH